ncbi:MAG: extracellular solute-binding protein [Lachnospiraceae bacterium]|nr:extracellular solute-binding protein [Lachnospiraceae bacterium]
MKRLHLRRGAAALACLLLLPLLASCHGSRMSDSFTMPEGIRPDRNYEITFWAKNDTNKTQTDIYHQAIRDFEAYYPNIHVNLRLYTDYGKIYNDVITNIQTNTTPNVCITYPDHIATYLTGAGTVAPLGELADDPVWGLGGSEVKFDAPTKEEIIPEYLGECMIGGELYALPYMRSSEACYVNRTMVEKLGFTLPDVLTWDFVWEVSDKAAQTLGSDGVYAANGQRVLIPFIYKSTDNMMIQYLKQADAPYSTDAGDILLFNDDTKVFLQEIATHVGNGAFSTFKISGYPANFLNAGQCIFAVDSTAGATWMGSDAPLVDISPDNLVDFETAVYPVPQLDPAHPRMISQGPSICVFNKADPEEVVASWLFAQYLLSDDVQIAYAETEGYVPVTSSARENSAYRDYLSRAGEDNKVHYAVKLAATELVLAHTSDTFVTPVFNGSSSLRDAAGNLIESTVKSVRRRQTVDDAYYAKLWQDTRSLYRLDDTLHAGADGSDLSDIPLPGLSRGLLLVLAAIWAGILVRLVIMRLQAGK